jgi:hypothetical protein
MQIIMVSNVKFNLKEFQKGCISPIGPTRRCNNPRLPKETNKPIMAPMIKIAKRMINALL